METVKYITFIKQQCSQWAERRHTGMILKNYSFHVTIMVLPFLLWDGCGCVYTAKQVHCYFCFNNQKSRFNKLPCMSGQYRHWKHAYISWNMAPMASWKKVFRYHAHGHKHNSAPTHKHTYMFDRASSKPRCEKVNYCCFGALQLCVVQVLSISNTLGSCKALPIE